MKSRPLNLRLLREVIFERDQWNIGVIDAPIETLLQPDVRPRIRWLPRPRSATFIADPFGVTVGGNSYLFYEFFDYREYRGRVFGARLAEDGTTTGEVELFPSATHLSYPYIFTWDGEIYCIPEMGQTRKVVLYKARRLPGEWREVGVLLDGVSAIDSTVFRHDGRWWLFHTDRELDGRTDLFAWHAASLNGPWTPHAETPVKRDIRSARPAGTPFVHNGQLYRPAQDHSRTYGGRVVFNRVDELSPRHFSETPQAFLDPERDGAYPDGVHTVSAMGNRTLVDGKRVGFLWWGLLGTIRKYLGRREVGGYGQA